MHRRQESHMLIACDAHTHTHAMGTRCFPAACASWPPNFSLRTPSHGGELSFVLYMKGALNRVRA